MSNLANRIASLTAELEIAMQERDNARPRPMDRELIDCQRELQWGIGIVQLELNRRIIEKDSVGHQDRRA